MPAVEDLFVHIGRTVAEAGEDPGDCFEVGGLAGPEAVALLLAFDTEHEVPAVDEGHGRVAGELESTGDHDRVPFATTSGPDDGAVERRSSMRRAGAAGLVDRIFAHEHPEERRTKETLAGSAPVSRAAGCRPKSSRHRERQ